MVEVCSDACLHDPRHVSHRCETTGAGCEKRQNRKAPPLPVQPGDDVSRERLACRHPHPVKKSQHVAKEAAECHVPLLQAHLCREKSTRVWSCFGWENHCLCKGNSTQVCSETVARGAEKMRISAREAHLVGWMWQRPLEGLPAELPEHRGWCHLPAPEWRATAHTSAHTVRLWASPPDGRGTDKQGSLII